MSANKIILNDEVIVDLTGDTVTEEDVVSGKIFHKANGEQSVGTGVIGGIYPVGTKVLKELGTHDVRDYEFAEVDMSGYHDTSNATADASTIRKGETAYGPDGLIIGEMEMFDLPTPTLTVRDNGLITSTVHLDKSGYVMDGTSETNFDMCDIAPEIIPSEVIVKGANIFGVEGTYAGIVPETVRVMYNNLVATPAHIHYTTIDESGNIVQKSYEKEAQPVNSAPAAHISLDLVVGSLFVVDYYQTSVDRYNVLPNTYAYDGTAMVVGTEAPYVHDDAGTYRLAMFIITPETTMIHTGRQGSMGVG